MLYHLPFPTADVQAASTNHCNRSTLTPTTLSQSSNHVTSYAGR